MRIFSDEDAVLRLTSALMMELNLEWMDRTHRGMSVATQADREVAASASKGIAHPSLRRAFSTF
jgi:hypothetical protein